MDDEASSGRRPLPRVAPAKPPAEERGPTPEPDASRLTRPPLVPTLVALAVVILLAVFVRADPATGVTGSGSPFTDEGFNLVGPHNFILLGHWATDEWSLYLLQIPFSVAEAAVFWLFGPGIVQARLLCIGFIGATTLGLGWGLRRPFGPAAAAIAAVAFGTSTLVLYYGRLVYLEDLIVLGLVVAVLTLQGAEGHPWFWGVVGGLSLALATGAKASALVPSLGIIAGVAVAAWSSRSLRGGDSNTPDGRPTARGQARWDPYSRWAAAAAATVVIAGLLWFTAIFLPQRQAIETSLVLEHGVSIPRSVAGLLRAALRFPGADGWLVRSAPLAVAGVAGALLAMGLGRGSSPLFRAVTWAAASWLLLGMGLLSVVAYRPSRYVVPMLPALAILLAAGVGAALPHLRARLGRRARPALAAGLASLIAVLAGPGLVAYAGWMEHATADLPRIEAATTNLVPPGSLVVGHNAAILLLSAPVAITQFTVPYNQDTYASRGARWFFAATDEPLLAVVERAHPAAWAARKTLYCAAWEGSVHCLFHLP